MSDTATINEIIEDMAILAALRRADADIAAGRVLSHEEVCRRVRANRGSLAHVPGSSADFLAEKHAEAERES